MSAGSEEGEPHPRFVLSTGGARAQPHSSASPQLSKRRAAFHKAFEEIAGREELLACFSCAWQREVPYHGRLYVSSGHLCFHASVLLRDIKVGARGGRGAVWGHGGLTTLAPRRLLSRWLLSVPSRKPTRRCWCPTRSASARRRGTR